METVMEEEKEIKDVNEEEAKTIYASTEIPKSKNVKEDEKESENIEIEVEGGK